MKHLISLFLILFFLCQNLGAQDVVESSSVDTTTVAAATHKPLAQNEALQPILEVRNPAYSAFSPFYGNFWGGSWSLHPGLNVQFGMSASVAFGKHAPSGVGFGQNLALAYVKPVSTRLLFAAGVFANHMKWGGYGGTELGVGVLAAYRATEKLDVYAYATASLVPKSALLWSPYYWDAPAKYRVGMGANWKVSDSFSLGLSVEASKREGFNPYHVENYNLMKPYRGLDW